MPVHDPPRVLLVNLPHHERVQRRWVASYYAPNFLIPPTELMGLASLLRDRAGAEIALVDAIAEGLTASDIASRYRAFEPDLVISLSGFRILNEDLAALGELRDALDAATVIFGYLPSQAPDVVARHAGVDHVLIGEPEEPLLALVEALAAGEDPAGISGLATSRGDEVVVGPARPRISDLDALPFPDHALVDLDLYNESFVPRPIGVVTSTRGCPYDCAFCVRAYGRKLVSRSWQSLAREIEELTRLGIRNVRFMDDTFTVESKRVIALCDWLERHHPEVRWTALTRLDRIDVELARAMARGGCRRLYVGIESADPDRLTAWGKGISIDQMRAGAAAARAAGIELSGFFIVGAPGETEAEVLRSADFAASLKLDFVIVTRLQYWMGTRLHRGEDGLIEFRLEGAEPGIGPEHDAGLYRLEQLFYRRFYARPGYVVQRLPGLLRSPGDTLRSALEMGRYLAGSAPVRDFI